MTTIVSSLDTERSQDSERSCATSRELLPGLPNHIGLHHILPKLPWWLSYILSSVNRGWRQAVRLRMLYDERVRSRTTSAFVLVSFTPTLDDRVLVLFSMRDNSWIELAPIPRVDGGSTWCSEFVSLNGKIYVIGGGLAGIGEPSTNRVCMLDLAANKHWQNCASMKQSRASFGSAVLNGKIYVFGGISSLQPVQGSEVYDPEDDSWSSIMPMPTHSRFSENVTTMGEEIILQGGWPMVDPKSYMSTDNPLMGPSYHKQIFTDSMEVYHTRKDEWRTVMMPYGRVYREVLFVVEDKLYSIDRWGIHVLNDRDGNSWTGVHSFDLGVCLGAYCGFCVVSPCPVCPVCGSCHCDTVVPTAVLPVDDELVAIAIFSIRPLRLEAEDFDHRVEYCLLRSKGFRKKSVKISWQKVEAPRSFAKPVCWYHTDSMCLIQL